MKLVLSLVQNQVETAVADLKHLEDSVVAIFRPVAYRRMEHRWRKVNIEIDVSSARWHAHTAWLEWTHAMDLYVLLEHHCPRPN